MTSSSLTSTMGFSRREGRSAASAKTGSVAFFGLILFIGLVYANPGNWFDALKDIGFAKVAAGVSLLALTLSWLLYNRALTLGGTVGWSLVLFFGLVGLSAVWSLSPTLSTDTFVDGLKYLAIFVLAANVVDSRRRLHIVVCALACASVIPAVGAIYSWAHGEHLVEGSRAGWIGIFGNPNDLAYYLVVGLAMTLAARETSRTRRQRLLFLLLLVPLVSAVVLTQSRGGMLAAGAVLALWTARAVRQARSAVAIALCLGCLFYLGPYSVWQARSERALYFGHDYSKEGRINAWKTGLSIAAEKPWTGVGAGAFMIAWPSYAPGEATHIYTEHNTFIQILSELGMPALLLFLAALASALYGMRQAGRDPSLRPYVRGVECGMAGFAVCSLTGGLAFSWPLYMLLGIAAATGRLGAAEAAEPAGVARPAGFGPTQPPVPGSARRKAA